ncbi:MAG: hypothetical protein QM783_15020 [Phycisphaerales bacterium]
MNALRQAWATITKQMAQLSGKDRALIGSLIVIGVLTLLLVGLWSTKQSMVPLLPDMPAADQAAAVAALKDADIEHENRGGKVYVPPAKQLYALAYLQQSGKMPENTQSLFAALSKSNNWMSSRTDSDRMANAALCEVLSGVMGNFKGVERATVMIDAPEPNGFGPSVRKPTASIGIVFKPGKTMDPEMVDAMAAMVKGAKAGLDTQNIRVIDLKRGEQYSPRVTDPLGTGMSAAGDYLGLTSKLEDRIHRKLSDLVTRMDPLSIVTVTVQADNTVKRTIKEEHAKDGKGSVSILESSTSETNNSRSGGESGGAPGITSNVTADVNSGGGGASGTSTEHTTTNDKFKVAVGTTKTDELAPGGMPTRVTVMVSLSREYIINLLKTKAPPAAAAAGGGNGAGAAAPTDPTQVDIEKAFADEKKRLETDLTPVVQNAAVETTASTLPRVTVSLIPVAQLGLAGLGGGGGGGAAAGTNMASLGGSGLVGQLTSGPMIRTAFLGLLAFVALGMMLMLVRKSSKPQNLPSPEELAGLPPVIDAGDDVVGEADEGATAMVGIELGETQIKTKKMLESIEELVKKNPTDGANLLNRWLNVER